MRDVLKYLLGTVFSVLLFFGLFLLYTSHYPMYFVMMTVAVTVPVSFMFFYCTTSFFVALLEVCKARE